MQNDKIVASPVKSFFVQMLTRDIALDDAILDLLDNCVDGALRTMSTSLKELCYNGFRAEITVSKDLFRIVDNCGGIPYDVLTKYAFRMGRDPSMPADKKPTVGTFGIGMKRAIFKIGDSCVVTTVNSDRKHRVEITPEWIADENNWTIGVQTESRGKNESEGTEIEIRGLSKLVAMEFDEDHSTFIQKLRDKIAATYSNIIAKGFSIIFNGRPVNGKNMLLVFDDQFKPYSYRSVIDGVNVFLTVGLTGPLVAEDKLSDYDEIRLSSQNAGWTVICNDRVVLYCDKTELTGWGDAGVPKYHPQYIRIYGVVEFEAEDASLLPTTTTKRGIDASNHIYAVVKNRMREGMKVFTDFTNKWKGREHEIAKIINCAKTKSVASVKTVIVKELKPTRARLRKEGEFVKPVVPLPPRKVSDERVYHVRIPKSHIEPVAEYLSIEGEDNRIVEKAFDHVYQKAIEQ